MMMDSVPRANDDGQFGIVDARGKAVAGPFDTNAAAWKALDRLANDDHAPARAKSNKKVLWGKPERPKSKKEKRKDKMTAKQEHRMKVNAAKPPGWVRTAAATKFDPANERAYRDYVLGTFGGSIRSAEDRPFDLPRRKGAGVKL